MGIYKIVRIANTLKQLKFRQIAYQLYYRIVPLSNQKIASYDVSSRAHVRFDNNIIDTEKYIEQNTFLFLNKSKSFDKIDWNFPNYGKLWTYNLNYFDFLNQAQL